MAWLGFDVIGVLKRGSGGATFPWSANRGRTGFSLFVLSGLWAKLGYFFAQTRSHLEVWELGERDSVSYSMGLHACKT